MIEHTRIVVADAGPLIHLDELDSLPLLASFAQVLVPTAVWQEVMRHRPAALQCADVPLRPCQAVANDSVAALSAVYTLHAGEREALCVCLSHPNAMLLTDDTAARLAARALAVDAHGTLGILIRAMRTGQLQQAQVLQRLHDIPKRSTLHVRPALLREIMDIVAQPK